MKIPAWFNCGRGTWDQGLISAALEDTLWPLPVEFEVGPEPQPNGVMVVHGEQARAYPPPGAPAGSLVIHTSDEHLGWSSSAHRGIRSWLMHANPHRPGDEFRMVPGWPPGTREGIATAPRKPLAERRLWGFAGQVQNDSRRAFVEAVRGRQDGDLRLSPGFAQGMDRPDYLRWLTTIAIAPSPAGNVNPEGFRLYEALEAGCLPVAQRSFPGFPDGFDWWAWEIGEAPPFPIVDDWSELPAILDRYAADPAELQRAANRAGAWWLAYKRRFAFRLVDDLRALGSQIEEAPAAIVMSASPVPSHPSTTMIEETIRKVRAYPEFARAEVLIMLDGVPLEHEARRSEYEEFTRRLIDLCNLNPEFRGCLPIIFDQHTHQANMTRAALPLVRTPFIFYVEHDTYPEGSIDFAGMLRVLRETDYANVIRLHLHHRVLEEHWHLYGEKAGDVLGVPLVTTIEWSQRPHLARTDWYRQMLDWYVPTDKAMWIEHAFYGPVFAAPWETYRVCIYAPEGNMTRSGHADGRRLGAAEPEPPGAHHDV